MIMNLTQEFIDMIKCPDKAGKKLRYLIVVPRIAVRLESYIFPIGIAYIASALKASGRNIYTLNLNYKDNYLSELSRTIEQNDIDVLLTGGLSGQYKQLKEILDTAKAINPRITTVVGGGIVTAEPDMAMSALEKCDYGVIGEGEITVNELAYCLESGIDPIQSNVHGIIDIYGNVTSPRDEIMNLDCIPFPDYDGLEFSRVLQMENSLLGADSSSLNLIMSRSCPYNCTFCFHSSGKKYRRRSLDNVFKEIDWLISKYRVNSFQIQDELFVDRSDYAVKFCERIKPYNLRYWAATRVDTANEQLLKLIKDSGCYTLFFGVESANDLILKSMRKNITVQQIENAFDAAQKVGLNVTSNIILGDLEETYESYQSSLAFLGNHPDYQIPVNALLTFPGSPIYKIACARGLITDRAKYFREGNFQINVTNMTYEGCSAMFDLADFFAQVKIIRRKYGINEIERGLKQLIENRKIAMWPATTSNINFIHQIMPEEFESDNLFLINENPEGRLHNPGGTVQCKKHIQTPDIIVSEEIKTLPYSFRKSSFQRFSEQVKNNYPLVTNILKIKNLLEQNEY